MIDRSHLWKNKVEISTPSRVKAEERFIRYRVQPLFTRNNGIFITLRFGKFLTPAEARDAYRRFMFQLVEWGGLEEQKVAYLGHMFARNGKGHIWPHAHVFAYSTKDRRTGAQITNISKLQRIKLDDYWRGITKWPGVVNSEPFKARHVYDAAGLVDYLVGEENLLAPGQCWERLPSHNLSLIEDKIIAKKLMETA